MSAVFRKGGDVTFLVEELKAVFDPRGGYWKPGGKYMPSLIAELGEVVEKHLVSIGMMPAPGLDEHQQRPDRGEARRVRGPHRTAGRLCREPLPGGRAALRQVQHHGRRHDGRLHDLPELRRL